MVELKKKYPVEQISSGHRGANAIFWEGLMEKDEQRSNIAAELVNHFPYSLWRQEDVSIESVPFDDEGGELACAVVMHIAARQMMPIRTPGKPRVLAIASNANIYCLLKIAKDYDISGRTIMGIGCAILCVDKKHLQRNGEFSDGAFNVMLTEIGLPYFKLRACVYEVQRGLI